MRIEPFLLSLALAAFVLPASAQTLQGPAMTQIQDCASGKCWAAHDADGSAVTVKETSHPNPDGSYTLCHLKKVEPLFGPKHPQKEPPCEVISKERLEKAARTNRMVGLGLGTAGGAMIGAILGGGLPGALIGGAIGFGVAWLAFKAIAHFNKP